MTGDKKIPKRMRFTQKTIEDLPIPEKGRYYVYDDRVPNLGVTVYASGKKSYFVVATIDHKTRRAKLGEFPYLRPEALRRKALETNYRIAEGHNPIEEKREQKAVREVETLTWPEAIKLFGKKKRRQVGTGQKIALKKSTVKDYEKRIKLLLGEDLFSGPVIATTEDALKKRVEERDEVAPTVTAAGLRSISAVWNWLGKQKQYKKTLPPNPVLEYAAENDGIHVPAAKENRIEPEEMPDWFDAVEELPQEVADFYFWLLFTGCRLSESLALEWGHLDFRRNVYALIDPKNRMDAALPIPSFMVDRLKPRQKKGGRIFPFAGDPIRQRAKVAAAIGKQWSAHDLRRTYSVIAEGVVTYVSVKRLMNQSYRDVTERYIGKPLNLPESQEKVAKEILRLAGRSAGNVVKLEAVK